MCCPGKDQDIKDIIRREVELLKLSHEDLKGFEEDKKEIQDLMQRGHTYHCACRQTWGDGECECKEMKGYLLGLNNK